MTNPTTPDQAEQAMSTCNKCGAQYPSAPSGAVHKCGRCSGGMMRPNKLPEELAFSPQGVAGGQDSFAESAKVSPEQIAENANCSQDRIAEARAEWDAIDRRKVEGESYANVDELARWAVAYGPVLLVALNPLPVEDMQAGWRDMKSAPKDGTKIICHNKHGEVFRAWWDEFDEGFDWQDDADSEQYPVGWMPMPALAASIGCGKN